MRKRSSQHHHLIPRGIIGRVAHFFRERQIYVRSKGEVQFVTVRPYMMVAGLIILMSGFFWIAFASINVTFKDELIAVKEHNLYQTRLDHEERISDLQQTIDRLNEKLMLDQDGYLQEVDKLRGNYGKLVDQHKRLTEFFRQGWMPLRKQNVALPVNNSSSTAPGKNGKQNFTPNRSGKGSFNQRSPLKLSPQQASMGQKYAAEFTSHRKAMAPLTDVRNEMQGFAKMQTKLLDEVIVFAKEETRKTRKLYNRLGINPDAVLKTAKLATADSVGGPFIAASANDILTKGVAVRMKKAVAHLDRTKLLQQQAKQLPLAMPVSNISRFSSHFGLRRDPLRKVAAIHTGIDIKAPYAAKIRATADGIVVAAGWAGGYGRLVKIQHEYGVATRYAHLRKILVKKGQRVKRGDAIGLLGNSGRSTGAHLHYETRLNGRPINPSRFWKARHDFQALSK